jgi:hypothetical protein
MALPKPHQRPRIDLSDNRPKDWQELPSWKVRPDDIIPDHGLVIRVDTGLADGALPGETLATGKTRITFQSQRTLDIKSSEVLRVFGYIR